MKAVVCQQGGLSVQEAPEPVLEHGQVLLKVLRCGICGSDLHARHHCDHASALFTRTGYPHFPRASQPIVFGHEFCGEVLEHGPECNGALKQGARVVALPLRRLAGRIDLVGLSADSPGAYAERVAVQESMMLAVPNGLSPDLAALTEPMAVAWHAMRRGEVARRDVAIVIGCGPVGLALICLLKARGVRTVVASDYSAARRGLALSCGADRVIDPAEESPFANWEEYGHVQGLSGLLELAVGTRERLGKLPLPWWHVWRMAEKLGANPARPVIFECVGAPGVIQHIIDGAPQFARIVVVGVCMQRDALEPAVAINKEIDLRFVMGYTPPEFREALHMIAHGTVACSQLITGVVGLHGVPGAFDALGSPDVHAKILIDPSRQGAAVC